MSYNKLKILCVRCGEKVLPEEGSVIYIHYTSNEGKPLKTPRLAAMCECGTQISKFIPKDPMVIDEMVEKYTSMGYNVQSEIVDDKIMKRSKCTYGRKLSGGCKKKPGRKKSPKTKSKKRSKCTYGRKLSGGCKKKPGRKSYSRSRK